MKTKTVKEISLTDGVIKYIEVETRATESVKYIHSDQFIADYNDKLEDYNFQVSEITRIQNVINGGGISNRIVAQLEHQKSGHEAIRDKYLMEWNGIYQPINNELNIL